MYCYARPRRLGGSTHVATYSYYLVLVSTISPLYYLYITTVMEGSGIITILHKQLVRVVRRDSPLCSSSSSGGGAAPPILLRSASTRASRHEDGLKRKGSVSLATGTRTRHDSSTRGSVRATININRRSTSTSSWSRSNICMINRSLIPNCRCQ